MYLYIYIVHICIYICKWIICNPPKMPCHWKKGICWRKGIKEKISSETAWKGYKNWQDKLNYSGVSPNLALVYLGSPLWRLHEAAWTLIQHPLLVGQVFIKAHHLNDWKNAQKSIFIDLSRGIRIWSMFLLWFLLGFYCTKPFLPPPLRTAGAASWGTGDSTCKQWRPAVFVMTAGTHS